MPYGNVSWNSKADGWVPVEEDRILKIIQNTKNTPWEVSAFTGGVIVPVWVIDAIKQYDDIGGYAGLSVFDYIDKVSDGKKEQPKHTF